MHILNLIKKREGKMGSENLLDSLLENASDIIYFKDEQNKYVKISKSAENFGLDASEITGKTDFDLYPEEQAKKISEEDADVINSGKSVEGEEKITFPTGEELWFSTKKAPRQNEEGNTIGMVGILKNISSHKKTERALKESEEVYKAIFRHSGTNVIIQNGKFVKANPKFEDLYGYPEEELLGRDSLSIVPNEEREQVRKNAIKMLKGERTEPYEHRIETKDGEHRWLLEKVTSIKYHGEKASLATFIDITERREETKRKELLQAFLRHDLRNKIQVSKAYLKLLEKQELSEEGEKYLKKASEAIKDSINLIERMRGEEKSEEIEITIEDIE